MSYPVMPLGFLGSQGDNDSYRIERSLRFNSADSAYLNRTFSGTPYTYTLSWWVKRGTLSTDQIMFGSRQGASNPSYVQLLPNNTISITLGVSSTVLTTTRVFRDPSAWYHFVLSVTPSATSYFYINGEQVGSWTSSATPYLFNSAYTNALGRYGDSASFYFDGYMAEINFIDGQALTPSSFGETDAITGRWKAKAYSGTYGTNGFYLKFADNSGTTATTLGKDSGGNGNNWTPNNFSVTAGAGNDSLVDSPTNYGTDSGVGGELRGNYCTLSGIDFSAGASGFSLTNGNLQYNKSGDSGNSRVRGTVFVGSGKYYWEYNITSVGAAGFAVGVATTQYKIGTVNDTPYRAYSNSGNKASGASSTSYGSSWTANDVIGVALDVDAGTIVFYKNNTSQGTAFTDLAGSSWTPWIQGEGVLNCNFGQRPFAYTAPSGFKALCTTNLPQPTIQKPSKYMDVVTYTGNGSTQTISSLGFSPDFLWSKSRSVGRAHRLIDSVRGIDNVLVSDTTAAEYTGSAISSFNSNGFSLKNADNYNVNSETYVAWAWDEAPIAGMDIVAATMNTSGSTTINHNLGVTPKFVITKNRSGTIDWNIYSASLGVNQYILLNSTAAATTSTGFWGTPTSTQFVFSSAFQNSGTYIAYLFAEVEGFSKFGSYTGNGSADGPFVWCGFRPRYLLIKCAGTAATNWIIHDTARNDINLSGKRLMANTSDAEASDNGIDILSNGFKMRSADGSTNTSTSTHIFAAFAESPFKYARAR